MNYKLFGTKTGLQASELILGAASLGNRTGYGTTYDEASQILNAYANAGGNFIDTSDTYQLGESEEIIGKFIEKQRDNFIICTKYTRSSDPNPGIANYGNHRKAMRQAVEASLKRLKTDYIDIYMPHFDDGITPIEEIARGLEDLVKSGKILYTGITNYPAWKAASIASIIPLNAMQTEYNLTQRTAERELLPMAHQFGLGTMMYSPLAGGLLTGKYRKGEIGRINKSSATSFKEDEITKAILDQLVKISEAFGASPGQIAFAWVMSKGAFPIIGARSINHINDSLNAASIALTPDHVAELDRLSFVSLGYPHDLLNKVRG